MSCLNKAPFLYNCIIENNIFTLTFALEMLFLFLTLNITNMKKGLHFLVLSILILFTINLQAQEFQWAKSYSGSDGTMNLNDQYNRIYNSAFDSQGNIYISGIFGQGAYIDTTNLLSYLPSNQSCSFIAKLDPDGNLLWHKAITKSYQYNECANWMEIVGDTAISMMASLTIEYNNDSWYIDTLLVGNYNDPTQYPMPPGYYTSFLTFDLDGNLKSQHFLERQNITNDGTPYYKEWLAFNMSISPFHIDKNGYIYIYVDLNRHNDSDSIRLIVDNQRSYNCGGFVVQQNPKIIKLTPNFDLVWTKDIIRDTFGAGPEMAYSFFPHITGLSADSEDNMYLTGWIDHYCNTDSNYNRTIDLGSNQRLIINDAGCDNLGFIIKYDTTGEPQWSYQLNGKKTLTGSRDFASYKTEIYNSTVNEENNSVYIIGSGSYDTVDCKLFFDDSTQFLYYDDNLMFEASSLYKGGVFFAKLDKETGKYLSHGISFSGQNTFFNCLSQTYTVSLAEKNNQVFSQVIYYRNLAGVDTVFSTGGIVNPSIAIMRWKDDGDVIDVINIPTSDNSSYLLTGNTILNDNGDLFITGMFEGDITFGDITLHGFNNRSNAFMAKYHDSTFVHTYVGDTSSLLREISLEGKGITVYPNPTKGDVYITTQGEKINSLSLYNINGQLLLKNENLKTTSEKINLSAFSKGVYVIKIITNKNVYSKKIIVN